MKKIKLSLLTIPAALTAVAPMCSLTSCKNTTTESIYDTTINEFKKLCLIPHSSDQFLNEVPYENGKVWNMSCYLRNRIETILNKPIFQDKYGNLVFDVDANDDSLKDAPKYAIQAHMDMVFNYNPEKFDHVPDEKTTKIELVTEVVNGVRVLHSKDYKTSIGADNGMGVAQILAILQHNEIKHGNLRFIITNCEENGLQGATLLVTETYPNVLKGINYMLNIDGEDLGDICVASSGAVGSYYYINTSDEHYKIDDSTPNALFKITISGFPGGHSGTDVVQRRDNALKVMNDVLIELNKSTDTTVKLNSISTPGSTVYNSIPSSCEVVVSVGSLTDLQTAQDKINSAFETVKTSHKNETIDKDKDFRSIPDGKKYDATQYDKATISITKASTSQYAIATLTASDTQQILTLQKSLQFGISYWPSDDDMKRMEGRQTSANVGPALGSISADGKTFSYSLASYSRSSDQSDVETFYETNQTAAATAYAFYKHDAKYDPWHRDTNTKLRELTKTAWKSTGVHEDKIAFSRTHGGLECSWWKQAMNNENSAIVSYGPQLHDCHKFTECVELDTVMPCINTTIYLLAHANDLK